jgi:cytochrome c-type biogenesis protein CcmH
MMMRRLLMAALAALSIAAAADPAERLKDPGQEARARALFPQFRCLVCQNESIDDSEADLARDLRLVVRQQIQAGRSDEEIKRFLVDRYGEFVLMKPSVSLGNAVLWGGPLAVVLIGGGLLALLLRRKEEAATAMLDADEEARLRRLLEE